MRKYILLASALALMAAAVAFAYQTAARDRDYRALLTRGDAAVKDGQTFGAIEAYSGAMALRPNSMLPFLRRGEAYELRGELDQAARDFRTAAAIDPTATRPIEALGDVFYAMKRFDRAADSYGRYLRLDDRSADVSYKLALARYQTGDLEATIDTLAATLKIDEQLPDAHYLLGLCLRDQRKMAEAQAAFERVLVLAPSHIPAREELADLHAVAGRRTEEIKQLQAIADLDRGHVERQVALALAQARSGQEETAVRTLGRALERGPGPAVYGALGQVWLAQAQAHQDPVSLSKAIEALARVASNPDASSEIVTLYGRALLMDEQFDAAESALQQASARYPIDPASLPLYASVAERQGHLDASRQALIDYAGLVGDAADTVLFAIRIADLSIKLKDPETAVSWLERALRGSPDDLRVLGRLADAQLRTGDRAGAQATIAHGLEHSPDNEALLALARQAR